MSEQGISGLFVVEYDVQRKFDAGEVMVVVGYFVHFFAPEGMDPIPKDVLFILDVSSSMSGNKIQQQRDAMDSILQDLHEGTDINTAMLRGIEFLNSITSEGTSGNRMKLLVFLTDGQASKGEQNRDNILNNIDKKNIKGLPVFNLAFGNDADYEFVKKVAVKNKGVARKIFEDSDASLQIKGFYNEISSSALQNVSFKYLDKNTDVTVNATKMNFDTFFNGKEIVIAGKLSDDNVQVLNLIVTGNGVDGHVELELESDIKKKAIGENNEAEKKKLNDKALEMSLKYKFVTPLTSMVVTKPDERDLGAYEENEDAGLALADTRTDPKTAGYSSGGSTSSRTPSGGSSSTSRIAYSKRRGSGGGGGGGGSRGGGGGGDPHFMLRINGIKFPICFDVDARDGDVIRMLKDPIAAWTTVFLACANNGQSVIDSWNASSSISTTINGAVTSDASACRLKQVRSSLIDNWSKHNIDQVKVEVYKNGSVIAAFYFNGLGTNHINWFSKNNLLGTTYTDLTRSSTVNYFSIEGIEERHFYINEHFGGCPADEGWLLVRDVTGQVAPCHFDHLTKPPYFIVSPGNKKGRFESGQYILADAMEISVHTNTCKCPSPISKGTEQIVG
ncbi:unnamed protein product [Mytilus edulis]|uniref:VWFA domain-containing protein n=1 Tax=Mytilus edulis TaxID=6550 RepID=A0A8S3VAJ7_MYTED|nr:unnamed protein product [Mytilus edulis]